ncbi:MAG TPA: FecR domain-containing protein [Agriterribacter sp.]|nr:FecR domain-containing protein [Agriterribacter sp.]
MDKQVFIQLLQKYRRGDITDEEQRFLEAYYNVFQNEPDILQSLSPEEINALKEGILKDTWDSVVERQPSAITTFKRVTPFRKVAVAAAIILGTWGGITAIYHLISDRNKAIAVVNKRPNQEGLEKAASVIPTHEKENRIIFLPDGSKVILSAGSKLNYPSTFDGTNKREVFLDGEAFFDIRHNPSKTFVVHTGSLTTVVLGTAFNIKAIPGENDIVVTVKRGKVKVSDKNKVLGVITPNQRITYDKQKIISVVSSVNNDNYLGWQDKDLFIDNLTISEAAKLMEERYKVKIIIVDPEVESLRFTTTFPRNEKLEQTLNSICFFNGLRYQYDRAESTVTITRK